ncbi:MAG: protein kinase domain-containing protein [Lachnospirales bacterium]
MNSLLKFLGEHSYHKSHYPTCKDYTFIKKMHVTDTTKVFMLEKHGRFYTLKVIDKKYKEYKHESKMLYELEGKFFPKIIKTFEDNDHYFELIKFKSGETIDLAVKDADLATVEKWYYDLLLLLKSVHDKNILHLDIKPTNILVNNKGVHLIDFGSASFIGEERRYRSISLQYSAPELFINEECQESKLTIEKRFKKDYTKTKMAVGRHTDIYSVALVFKEIIDADFKEAYELDDYNFFIGVLAKSLGEDVNERYQSVDEILDSRG